VLGQNSSGEELTHRKLLGGRSTSRLSGTDPCCGYHNVEVSVNNCFFICYMTIELSSGILNDYFLK
jgi:hypothetical protein